MQRKLGIALVGSWLVFGAGAGTTSCSDDSSGSNQPTCAVGAESCPCTAGGACDTGLVCANQVCVPAGSGGASGGAGAGGAGATGGAGAAGGAGGAGGAGTGGTTTDGGGGSAGGCQECTAIDVLFALDGSLSVDDELSALAAPQAFEGILNALGSVGCNVSYRVGVTNDDDGGWFGANGKQWFDSTTMSTAEISSSFATAANQVTVGGGAGIGCEHVLTSAKDLLLGDTTGFLRSDALLVLVLITDVDDYGVYDQVNGNTCALGCSTAPPSVGDVRDALVALKGGDPARVVTVVVAGDPNTIAGTDVCGRPGSCCGSTDCSAYHATRLASFVGLMPGQNGSFENICNGAASVPTSVLAGVQNNVAPACAALPPPP